jgi:hypothetical protein
MESTSRSVSRRISTRPRWPAAGPGCNRISGQVSERTSATSYSATEASSIAVLCSSEGPLPRPAPAGLA